MERLTGIGVSPGVVVGRAVILTQRTEVMRFPIPPDRVEREVEALRRARDQSKQQLDDIRQRVAHGPASELAALFDAQLLMLDDQMLIGRAEAIIRTERVNAAWAVHRAYEELYQVFSAMEDPYLRERENDVADVARIVMREGMARIVSFDLTADDDEVWGWGLGCNGAFELFVEPAAKAAEVAGALRIALEEERPIAMITVLDSSVPDVEQGDREAAYDLARTIRPRSITELVEFVWPEYPPRPEMFDVLADAYNAYTTYREV